MNVPDIPPGPLSRATCDALNEFLRSLAHLDAQGIQPVPPIAINHAPGGGLIISADIDRKFWAKILAYDAATKGYSFTELQTQSAGKFSVDVYGQAGTAASGPAFEINGNASVPPDSVVVMWHGNRNVGHPGDECLFAYQSGPIWAILTGQGSDGLTPPRNAYDWTQVKPGPDVNPYRPGGTNLDGQGRTGVGWVAVAGGLGGTHDGTGPTGNPLYEENDQRIPVTNAEPNVVPVWPGKVRDDGTQEWVCSFERDHFRARNDGLVAPATYNFTEVYPPGTVTPQGRTAPTLPPMTECNGNTFVPVNAVVDVTEYNVAGVKSYFFNWEGYGSGCGITVDQVAHTITLNLAGQLGPGLGGYGGCGAQVVTGCGIKIVGNAVTFDRDKVMGPGLSTWGTCGIQDVDQATVRIGINITNINLYGGQEGITYVLPDGWLCIWVGTDCGGVGAFRCWQTTILCGPSGSGSASGSAGGVPPPPCCNCPNPPTTWVLTVSGIFSGPGDCAACAPYNGTWHLTYTGNIVCRWDSENATALCGSGAPGVAWFLVCSVGGQWELHMNGGSPGEPDNIYTLGDLAFDCMGPNIMTLETQGIHCSGTPGSVTITPG